MYLFTYCSPIVQKRAGQQYRSDKTPVLPPIKLLDGPGHSTASAQQMYIEQLRNEVCDLQQQLRATQRENRLLQHLQSRHTTALQNFQDVQADLPQLLSNHSSEVKALQELSRRDKAQINNLSRKLQSTESTLLHTRDTLHRLQRLTQDQHLEERETLTHRLSVLTVDMDKKNKRIQVLCKVKLQGCVCVWSSNISLNDLNFSIHTRIWRQTWR